MSSNLQFWIGLAFAIPLSIVANLFTPHIQKLIASRFSAYAEKRKAIQAKESDRIVEFINNPQKFNTYLLVTLVGATMLGAAIGVFSALLFMLGSFADQSFVSILAQFMTVFGGLLVTKICLDAVKMAAKIREIEKLV